MTIAEEVHQIGVTQQRVWRWCKLYYDYGGKGQVREPEKESQGLRRVVSDLPMDKLLLLTEAAKGKVWAH